VGALRADGLRILAPLYEFVFTPVCCHCGAPLSFPERFLCPSCWAALRVLDRADPLYGEALWRLTAQGECDGLVSLFAFVQGSPVQSLLHELKYRGRAGAGLRLGRMLGRAAGREGDIAVPVPLHRVRRRERGFNQSAVLCRGMSAESGIPVGEHVKRIRRTPSQTSLGEEARRANVEGAFALRRGVKHLVAGRSVLLVDDVMTTGATVRACARVLKDGGARHVVVCTVALAA
jgi:ComF family protein